MNYFPPNAEQRKDLIETYIEQIRAAPSIPLNLEILNDSKSQVKIKKIPIKLKFNNHCHFIKCYF